MTTYYVRDLGGVSQLVKIVDNANAYLYVNGKWEPQQNFIKILFEDDGFNEITEAKAKSIMKELDENA